MAWSLGNFSLPSLDSTTLTDALAKSSVSGVRVPWDGTEIKSTFWKAFSIQGERWDQNYPYRFLVVDARYGTVLTGNSAATVVPEISNQQEIYNVIDSTWELVLPITPQQLSITDLSTVSTTATLKGVLEEHGGAKFKMISISGTTGGWAAKPAIGGSSGSFLGGFFAGAAESFGNLMDSVGRVTRAFSGSHPVSPPVTQKPDIDSYSQTGYFRALAMALFIEQYQELKKDAKNRHLRLVFDMPKQNQSFIVSPIKSTVFQNVDRPTEYKFNIELKAWKRIELDFQVNDIPTELPPLDVSLFSQISSAISESRRLLGSASNLVQSVRSDLNATFGLLRQVSLVVKDASGLALSVADMPGQIVGDLESAIDDSLSNIKQAFDNFGQFDDRLKGSLDKISSGLSKLSGRKSQNEGMPIGQVVAGNSSGINKSFGRSPTSSSAQTITQTSILAGSSDSISSSAKTISTDSSFADADALANSASANSSKTDPVRQLFDQPDQNFELFDAIPLNLLRISTPVQSKIDAEMAYIRSLTTSDLIDIRNQIDSLAADLANQLGASDAFYADLYGKPAPKVRTLPLTIEENELLASLYEVIQGLDSITATKQFDDNKVQNPFEYVGGLANQLEIDFLDLPSKILQPVPFGASVEEIAERYLGDKDKWIEIVTLNSLKPPYIDEDGFVVPFTSNASGRLFNVIDNDKRFFVGQQVTLYSTMVKPFNRFITNIEVFGENSYLITVDGLDNLDSLKLVDGASVKGYLPGTVNSQNTIFIPSNEAPDVDTRTRTIPFLEQQDKLTSISKIDFLLDDNGDIAINSLGDFRLAAGLTNLTQAMKLKFLTEKGTLSRHNTYGFPIGIGDNNADASVADMVKGINAMVAEDPRFSGISKLVIDRSGPKTSINVGVIIRKSGNIFPITFSV